MRIHRVLFLLIPLLILFSSTVFGQAFGKKQIVIQPGVGVNPTFCCPQDLPTSSYNIAVHYGISESFSVGGFYTWMSAFRTYSGLIPIQSSNGSPGALWMESHKWAMNMIGIRSTYHFEKL